MLGLGSALRLKECMSVGAGESESEKNVGMRVTEPLGNRNKATDKCKGGFHEKWHSFVLESTKHV